MDLLVGSRQGGHKSQAGSRSTYEPQASGEVTIYTLRSQTTTSSSQAAKQRPPPPVHLDWRRDHHHGQNEGTIWKKVEYQGSPELGLSNAKFGYLEDGYHDWRWHYGGY